MCAIPHKEGIGFRLLPVGVRPCIFSALVVHTDQNERSAKFMDVLLAYRKFLKSKAQKIFQEEVTDTALIIS